VAHEWRQSLQRSLLVPAQPDFPTDSNVHCWHVSLRKDVEETVVPTKAPFSVSSSRSPSRFLLTHCLIVGFSLHHFTTCHPDPSFHRIRIGSKLTNISGRLRPPSSTCAQAMYTNHRSPRLVFTQPGRPGGKGSAQEPGFVGRWGGSESSSNGLRFNPLIIRNLSRLRGRRSPGTWTPVLKLYRSTGCGLSTSIPSATQPSKLPHIILLKGFARRDPLDTSSRNS
jgi:hypothetical protein